jgi:putative endonuclease
VSSVKIGNQAELAVAEELINRGYEILELNWRTKFAEIDILAKKDKTIYFVEVKYRHTESAGDGFDYITKQKLQHMKRAAEAWVLANNWHGEYQLLAAAVGNEYKSLDIREII